jgi:hypothetical protein
MMSKLLSRGIAIVILLGSCCLINAQVFRVQAGSSTLFNADGASMDFRADKYSGDVGIGMVNGEFHYGASFQTKLGDNTVKLGDDQVRFELPTDIFDASHYFLARGIGITRSSDDTRTWIFTGASSQGFSTPFFGAADSANAMGALFYEKRLSDRLTLFSRNIFSSRQTMIQAAEYKLAQGVRAAVAVGTGNNAKYAATSLAIDRKKYDLKASYVAPSDGFVRLRAPNADLASEVEGGNVSFTYRPKHGYALTLTHENIVQPGRDSQPAEHASANEVFATGNAAKVSFGGGLFTTKAFDHAALGTAFFAGRNLTSRIAVKANYDRSVPNVGLPSDSIGANVRAAITQRLTLIQVVSRSNGQFTTSFGGEYIGNRFNGHLDYQTVFLPLRPDKPLQQTMGFSASMNLFGGFRAIAGSNVAADGKLRYTFGISKFFYRTVAGGGDLSAAAYHFGRYVVSGTVFDAAGQPFAGAAIVIGKETVYTDTEGNFLLRVNRRVSMALSVNFDEFITPGDFELVNAPSSVIPEAEDQPVPVRVTIRRKPKTPAQTPTPSRPPA